MGENFKPTYLFDEGSTITWVPCGKKLTCDYPGVMMKSGSDVFMDKEVDVIEMDGEFSNLAELCYIENHMNNVDSKFSGELTQAMIKDKGGSWIQQWIWLFPSP